MTLKMRTMVLVLVFGLVAEGCGKRSVNLSVKAADSERDQPTAALVRKVDLSYRSPEGKEEMRESLAVLGLSQPVSARSDLLKEVRVQEGGTFEARGYTSEGLLMLRGLAQARDDSDTVEITMGREGEQARPLGQPLLRRVRLVNVPAASGFEREARDLVPGSSEAGEEKCTGLPGLKINSAGGVYPKLILEGAVKAPKFTIEIGVRGDKGLFKALEAARVLPINAAGDSELEFGRQFLKGALLEHAWRLLLRLHSSHYEGCFELTTHPELSPPLATAHLGAGVGQARRGNFPNVDPAGYVEVYNPNAVPVRVDVTGVAENHPQTEWLRLCFDLVGKTMSVPNLQCLPTIAAKLELSPGETRRVGLFGAMTANTPTLYDMATRGLRVQWMVNATAVQASDAEYGVFPTQALMMDL